MLAVYGRMLTWPVVMYKGDKTASESSGGYFQQPVSLKKWGCLGILGSGNNSEPGSYKSATKESRKNLDACGIQTSEPFSDQIILDKSRTMDDIIHEMHQKRKLNIILIVLPRKETKLYNRIKKSCDRTEGVHTVRP